MSERILQEFQSSFSSAGRSFVLDPFVGSGTVAVEASKFSRYFVGQDSNPFAVLVSKSKCTQPGFSKDEFSEIAPRMREENPIIPSPYLARYHTKTQLKALGKIRGLVDDLDGARNLGLVILAKTCQQHSRLRKTPAPRFKETRIRANEEDILGDFSEAFVEALDDLESNRQWPKAGCDFVVADSATSIPNRIDAILTSPPFANNIDYIRHTQLELLWTGLATTGKNLGQLRSVQIPACEASARKSKHGTDKEWVLKHLSNLPHSRNYEKFISQYFFAMERHLEMVADALKWEAWYTIGDSWYGDCHIPTHKILRRIAEEEGLNATLSTIGKRPGGRTLYLLKLSPT